MLNTKTILMVVLNIICFSVLLIIAMNIEIKLLSFLLGALAGLICFLILKHNYIGGDNNKNET